MLAQPEDNLPRVPWGGTYQDLLSLPHNGPAVFRMKLPSNTPQRQSHAVMTPRTWPTRLLPARRRPQHGLGTCRGGSSSERVPSSSGFAPRGEARANRFPPAGWPESCLPGRTRPLKPTLKGQSSHVYVTRIKTQCATAGETGRPGTPAGPSRGRWPRARACWGWKVAGERAGPSRCHSDGEAGGPPEGLEPAS